MRSATSIGINSGAERELNVMPQRQAPPADDIVFGIVRRRGAMILLKDVGVDPIPNCTPDIKQGIARWARTR